ncbi:MAG: glycosyltransferase [Thermodesulfobacteriota bacterium]|nr:glycosyltransferase [Thermodesulfobacteriota bacterium]
MKIKMVGPVRPQIQTIISVVVPVYNDSRGIAATLHALFRQRYPGDRFEIIVVDNNSTDQTFAVIEKIAAVFSGNIIVAKEPVQSSYAARNTGIRLASGRYLAFIDANMTVPEDWLEKGVACLDQGRGDYIGCRIRVVPGWGSENPGIYERYHMAIGFPVADYMKHDGYAPTACLFVAKKVIERCGGFDPELFSGGDVEFGTRVQDAGFVQYYDADNVMNYPARATWHALVKKQKRVVSGQIALRRKFPGRFACNRVKDVLVWGIQIFPVVSPWVLKKIRHPAKDVFQKFVIFYLLRLYTCWLKFSHRCWF